MRLLSQPERDCAYDLVVVGSGFSASFFLKAYLRQAPAGARVLVIERGQLWSHERKLRERRNSPVEASSVIRKSGDPNKDWRFTIGFGGGSSCWWGNTPRMLPEDFRLRTAYGVGRDWPLSYDDLLPYYQEVESVMGVAGPDDIAVYPRPAHYRLPPHRLSQVQAALADAYPDEFFALPSARASTEAAGRKRCAASSSCWLCPMDAKFTVQNSMLSVYQDPRVSVLLEAEVLALERHAGAVRGVVFRHAGVEHSVRAEVCVLAAHALFNPAILLRSGFSHPLLGGNLHEQIGVKAEVFLDGLNNFDGSTSVTGVGYMGYAGAHRREAGACMLEAWNIGPLRAENGRWQQVLHVRLVVEDLPQPRNRVSLDVASSRPQVHFGERSAYGLAGVHRASRMLERWMSVLPVERIEISDTPEASESHIQGTTVMGADPATAVLDPYLRYHGHDNLFVLGSGAFPSGPPANPTLTLSALALRAASALGSAAPA